MGPRSCTMGTGGPVVISSRSTFRPATVSSSSSPSSSATSSGTSNFVPSTNTIWTLVPASNNSPSVTSTLAILPISRLPTRSATPKISAGAMVNARRASAGDKPAAIALRALVMTVPGCSIPSE